MQMNNKMWKKLRKNCKTKDNFSELLRQGQ